jgi:hypothetical protein
MEYENGINKSRNPWRKTLKIEKEKTNPNKTNETQIPICQSLISSFPFDQHKNDYFPFSLFAINECCVLPAGILIVSIKMENPLLFDLEDCINICWFVGNLFRVVLMGILG